jgi:hypothetical protein
MCVATYFIDANPRFEASATAAATAVRSLIGALVPLFGRSMYKAMGLVSSIRTSCMKDLY